MGTHAARLQRWPAVASLARPTESSGLAKTPYTIVVGEKEGAAKSV
jgi:hypothetical protein